MKTNDPKQFTLWNDVPVRKEHLSWRPPSEFPSLRGIDELCLDFETDGLDWRGGHRAIGVAISLPDKDPGGRCFYLPWGHKPGGNLPKDKVLAWMRSEIRGKTIHNANIKFDHQMALEDGVDFEALGNKLRDPQHSAALLDDSRRRFALDELGKFYLGEGKTGQELDKTRMAEYHAGEVAPYAIQDVRLARRLKDKFHPMLVAQDLMRVQELEDRLIYTVARMERAGAPLNIPLLEDWVKRSGREVDTLMWELTKEAGFVVDPKKPSTMEKLFNKLDIPFTEFTESGRPSFDDGVLARSDHPLVKKARRIKKLKDHRSKFLLPYWEAAKDTGILYYHLHQLRSDEGGTVSGRFSATDENVQQVASVEKQLAQLGEDYIIRELFIPADKRYKWLSADAKQIEYRIFASLAGSKMIYDAYAADPNADFHTLVMNMIHVVKAGITRKKAKDVNFAKVYGAGIRKIAAMLGISVGEAEQFVQVYDHAFPEAQQLLSKASHLAATRGYVRTLLGRRSRFTDRRRLHKALNSVIQGGAADIAKQKLIEIDDAREETGFILRFPVHDEVDGDTPSEECTARIEEILNYQSFPLKVPILWDIGVGDNWKECC